VQFYSIAELVISRKQKMVFDYFKT